LFREEAGGAKLCGEEIIKLTTRSEGCLMVKKMLWRNERPLQKMAYKNVSGG
jgi:hypothetical protein